MVAQLNMQDEASNAVAVAVPNSGQMLQAAAQSEFGLQVGLSELFNNNDDGNAEGSGNAAVVAVGVLVMLAATGGLSSSFSSRGGSRKRRR
jgi:hypothetical protein